MKSTKKTTKLAAKTRPKRKALPAEKKQSGLKRLLFGEVKPDLTELESGSTTILDILSPTTWTPRTGTISSWIAYITPTST